MDAYYNTVTYELEKNRGWHYIKVVMDEEVVKLAMSIAETSDMTLDQINFRRGAIFAAKQLLDLPSRLRVKLENEIALSGEDDKIKSNIQDVIHTDS